MLCLASASFAPVLSAQQSFTPGALDTSFGAQLDGSVQAILVQPDGQLLVQGGFWISGVPSYTRLARFSRDGAHDPIFAPTSGVPSQITALVLQPDGKLLVGSEWEFLKRFLPDGSVDTSFGLSLPTPDPDRLHCCYFWTTALALQTDGRILAAGHRLYRGSEEFVWVAPQVLRLLPNGNLDDSFTPYPATVQKLAVLADQRILVMGTEVTRLFPNGTRDTNFVAGPFSAGPFGTSAKVLSFAFQREGRILIGGNFTNVQGQVRDRIARLELDGQLDQSFNPPLSTGDPRHGVNAIAVQSDGRVLVGGTFKTLGGLPYAGLARLHADGSLDSTFPPIHGLQEDGEAAISSVVIQDETRAVIGGSGLGTDGIFESGDLLRIHLGNPAPRLSVLQGQGGLLQLTYPYSGSYDFAVAYATNLMQPASNWTVLGSATDTGAGRYRFTDRVLTFEPQRYYQLRGIGVPSPR